MQAEHSTEPRLLIPQLQPFYDKVNVLAWPLVRFAVGLNLVLHGWPKFMRGPSSMAETFEKMGFAPGASWAWAAAAVELIGGLGIMLGLGTRFCAAAVTVEMAFIFFTYVPNGFSWLARGYEYVLLWGLVSLAIALRGGGAYSLDRKFGVQL